MAAGASGSDDETLAFYDREAVAYSARRVAEKPPTLAAFLGRLESGAHILDLGCGGGQDAQVMLSDGFDVTAVDGSSGLAAIAEARIGRPVRVMRFEALDDAEAFDAVWANASLLHVPADGLTEVLRRIWRAMRPGGLFYAGYKSGEGGDRDALGRYYNFPTRAALVAAYEAAGPWASLDIETRQGGGYDGEMRTWLHLTAVKPG